MPARRLKMMPLCHYFFYCQQNNEANQISEAKINETTCSTHVPWYDETPCCPCFLALGAHRWTCCLFTDANYDFAHYPLIVRKIIIRDTNESLTRKIYATLTKCETSSIMQYAIMYVLK